jgi:TnpA family transposase
MGDSVEGLTAADLQQTARGLVREATVKAANAQIVEHLHQVDFAAAWGDGRLSSSDGQRFRAPPGTLIGAYHPRYFGHYDKAVTVYTHVSDRLGVFSTQVISCAPREATYVLDGLLTTPPWSPGCTPRTRTASPSPCGVYAIFWESISCRA